MTLIEERRIKYDDDVLGHDRSVPAFIENVREGSGHLLNGDARQDRAEEGLESGDIERPNAGDAFIMAGSGQEKLI